MVRRSASALIGFAALALAGCGEQGEAPVPGAFVDAVRAGQSSTTVVLPERLPPDLLDAWALQSGDVSTLNFYSRNEPVVLVCTGDADTCRKANIGSPEIRTESVDGADVVLLLGRRDDPGAPEPRLSAELADFWSQVDLGVTDPDWLTGG